MLLAEGIIGKEIRHGYWGLMSIVSQYQSVYSMRCRKFLSVSEVGPIESCRLCLPDSRQ